MPALSLSAVLQVVAKERARFTSELLALPVSLNNVASTSPALAIPTIQTSRTPIHDHQRLRAALVAHRRAGREARPVAGDFDVFHRLRIARVFRSRVYVRVFFLLQFVRTALL